MKTIIKLILVCLIFGTVSCRDTKKEDAETKAAVEQIKIIENEVDAVSDEIEKEVKALEDELNELKTL